ncbi:hypothetical protein VTL71DRAFT_9565 [Oculimacula yallundae]|uniref:Actin-like ATPase domain-containing protein n=1 Tax=Oculimacula yallundae TaxID=86028 RepID=A0ABR4BR79_9HELO
MESLKDLTLGLRSTRKLIVGIDFRTTFSGIAFAETRRADHHFIIETWPSSLGGTTSEKVPTELRYTTPDIEWGYQIPSGAERHQWFKLGFADSNIEGMVQSEESERLTTDYLAQLYSHLMYTLEQRFGTAIVRSMNLEFCITVPAIWSEAAKQKTLEACQNAGLESSAEILLVSEPEAAAVSALHGLDPHELNVGDSFVLCDAGGGTVDLVSYSITALHPLLEVKEVAAGTGGLCGSTFLNRRFGEFLESKLGLEPGWNEEMLADAMDRFETVFKRNYSPSTAAAGYTITVPDLADNRPLGVRRGRFTITPADMQDIFEPIVLKIVQLIRGQIRDSETDITAVLLVGGLGQNNYLKERISSAIGDVEVLQPPWAWTAVVRGAVMMGLSRADSSLASVGIVSRTARKHYGVDLSCNFESSKHLGSKRYWSSKYLRFRVHAMHWFICKGDDVVENQPIAIGFHHDYLVSGGNPRSISLSVWCDSESRQAPIHKTQALQKLVNLEADLTHLTDRHLEHTITTRQDGLDYYCIEGAIEATFYSATTKYILLLQGKRYDTVTAEYV